MKKGASTIIIVGLIALNACKNEVASETAPGPTGSAPTSPEVVATPPQVVSAAPSQTPTAVVTNTPPAPTTTPEEAKADASEVDACCSALDKLQKTTRDKLVKQKAEVGERICRGIASRVRKGESAKASALVQIRANLAGVPIPSSCK